MKKPLFVAFLYFISFISVAQRISIQPSVLDFRLGPAAVQAQSVSITNFSGKKLVFQAYLADWLRDSTGGHQYFRPDTLEESCASWIQLNKNLLEVEPNETAELLIQLQTPADIEKLKKMKWAMLFIQSADELDSTSRAQKQIQTQIKEIMRIGIHIYQTPPVASLLQAKALSLKPAGPEKNAFEFLMKNTGEGMLQCKSFLEFTEVSTGKVYRSEKTEYPVFPNGIRKTKLVMPADLPKGKYSALAVLDIGEDMPLEAIEREVEIQ